jgi:Tol biopolymer transport system component
MLAVAAYAGEPVVERASVSSLGAPANGESGRPQLSADGRFVAFQSLAQNLVVGDHNGAGTFEVAGEPVEGWDVFVRDLQLGTTVRVSTTSQATDPAGDSVLPAISADGRFVAFASNAWNLTAFDNNKSRDIFLVDRDTGALECVSIGESGRPGNLLSDNPAISGDARFVAFDSHASDLVAGDTNSFGAFSGRDVFVRDRLAGSIERISRGLNADESDGDSALPALSADGRYAAFISDASNLVQADTNNATDVFVVDRSTAGTVRVSVGDFGEELGGGAYSPISVSDDGCRVAFSVVVGVRLYDCTTGVTQRIGDLAAQWELVRRSLRMAVPSYSWHSRGRPIRTSIWTSSVLTYRVRSSHSSSLEQ